MPQSPATVTIPLKTKKVYGYLNGETKDHPILVDKDGTRIVCRETLFSYFDIPKGITRIWLTVARSRRTGFSTATFRRFGDIEFGGKIYETFQDARLILDDLGIDRDGGKFYFTIEYKG
jgi:DNA-directed RNA polymerase subunit N (RpoN/RPB10)